LSSLIREHHLTMGNHMKNYTVYLLAVCLYLLTTSCALLGAKVDGLPVAKLNQPTFVHLKGIQGFESVGRMYSKTVVSEKKGDKLTETEVKFADIDVNSEILLVDRGKALIYFLQRTIRSDSNMDLADLAMPELNKEIKMTMYPNAEVFEVEGKPKTSIFYVPPISLPLHKVKVGDTWTMKRIWLTAKTGIPIQIELVTVFKNLLKCSEDDLCADLELSGEISLPTADPEKLNILSDMKGRVLFSLKTGTVVWSAVRSTEEIAVGGKVQVVQSCTNTALIKPIEHKLVDDSNLKCEPTDKTPMAWTLLAK